MRAYLIIIPLLLAACSNLGPPYFEGEPQVAPTPPPPPPPQRRWEPREVVADARRIEGGTVTVRPGDSLSVIAERAGSSVRAIARANGLAPPYVIHPGERLEIPGGRYHRVKSGETGIAIALAYDAGWDRIVAANALKPPYILRVGDRLLLPEPRPPARPMTPQERAAAFSIDIDALIAGSEPAVPATAPPAATARTTLPPPPASFDGSFAWPVEGRIVSGFGPKEGGLYNDGINIAAAPGTPVRAAASGVVVYAGDGIGGFGNLVLVKHDDDWISAYGHADALYVERGDTVAQGQTLAEVGSTGSVDSPQLHFELRKGRKPVDPQAHLPAS